MRHLVVAACLATFPAFALAQSSWTRDAQIAAAVDPIQAERYRTLPTVRPWPSAWFQPRETVRGGVAKPLTVAPTRRIAPAALQAARDYAMKDTQALLVWHDGKLVLEEYGQGAKATDQLNSYYMHYAVLSMLYGIAIGEGKIGSVDDPVGKYIGEWKDDARGRIPLRDLLNMQSGLEMYFDNPDPRSKAARLFMSADTTTPALEFAAAKPPRQVFEYNYLVPEILGIALERAVGMRYVDYLSTRLWRPLGAADASVWLDRPGGRPHFNSSLFASGRDWLAVGRLILDKGRANGRQIVPAAWIRTMTTPSATNPNYGMLWIGTPYVPVRALAKEVPYTVKSSAPYAAPDLVFIDGYGGQRVYVVPSKKLVIVRVGLTRRDWNDAALPNAVIAGIR